MTSGSTWTVQDLNLKCDLFKYLRENYIMRLQKQQFRTCFSHSMISQRKNSSILPSKYLGISNLILTKWFCWGFVQQNPFHHSYSDDCGKLPHVIHKTILTIFGKTSRKLFLCFCFFSRKIYVFIQLFMFVHFSCSWFSRFLLIFENSGFVSFRVRFRENHVCSCSNL